MAESAVPRTVSAGHPAQHEWDLDANGASRDVSGESPESAGRGGGAGQGEQLDER
ncbi:hypothetical protein [Actinoallomurus sp. NPDC052274]|uniref:hypothetical protein n=1 Tax=Actinoallomurus sp. NPDC052274 TaxID=3155420 RepID=UPI0034448243